MESRHKTTRRKFIKNASKSSIALVISPTLLSGCSNINNFAVEATKSNLFDKSLEMMSHIAPLGNHGPMAAEALVSLGFENQLPSFVKQFLNEFSATYPPKKQKVVEEDWKDLLGKGELISDWIEFYENEINKRKWKETINKWIERLAPGLSASATHGIIRTGHAVRSLLRKETDLRKKELAEALGYWAAHYEEMPKSEKKDNLKLDIKEAINKIPILPPEKFILKGNIVSSLRNLQNFKEFSDVTTFIEIEDNYENFISKLTESFANAFVEKVQRRNLIGLIHIITSLSSIRTLIPFVSENTKKQLLFYGWQTAAGIISISGTNKNAQINTKDEVNQEELIKKAVKSNEVHAIKFTEACIREYKLNPKQIYLHASKEAVDRLA